MIYLFALLHRAGIFCTLHAATLENSHRARLVLSWSILLLGLFLFVTVQSQLILPPLWGRALPPEVDDSLAYLVRTTKLQECFFQDCPALQDLQQQFSEPSADAEIQRQVDLASFPFPFYHPLFSLLLLGVSRFTGNLYNAYRVVWSLSPVLFGLGFAYFLSTLWGRTAAGIALGFLAFKVLPDSGLHYLTPSNLSLGLALLVWARLIQSKGDAPWTLGLGTLALLTMHPIGGIYTIISFCLAGLAAEDRIPRRMQYVMGTCLLVIGGAVLFAPLLKEFSVFNLWEALGNVFRGGLLRPFSVAATNVAGITTEFLRLKNGLFIFLPIFFLVPTLGYLTVPATRQVMIRRFMTIYSIVLLGSLFHSNFASAPGDLFFRLWIPWLAIIFGGMGQGIAYILHQNLLFLVRFQGGLQFWEGFEIAKAWPILTLAIILGYMIETCSVGGHQIYATREYMRHRQALNFSVHQPKLLLEQSQPGDLVVYTAYIPMAHYFVQGALQRGALYYHPAFQQWKAVGKWPSRDKIRFLVAYNPTVYHPTLIGLDEKDRCISSPRFSYSPEHKPRLYEPLGRGGHLVARDFHWIEIEPQQGDFPSTLRVQVNNPGRPAELQCQVLSHSDTARPGPSLKVTVAGKWSGWVEFGMPQVVGTRGYRLVLPRGHNRLLIGGLTLGYSPYRWPWASKAVLTCLAKDPTTGLVVFSFDTTSLIPPPLKSRKATVLDDHGASVLLRLDQESD